MLCRLSPRPTNQLLQRFPYTTWPNSKYTITKSLGNLASRGNRQAKNFLFFVCCNAGNLWVDGALALEVDRTTLEDLTRYAPVSDAAAQQA